MGQAYSYNACCCTDNSRNYVETEEKVPQNDDQWHMERADIALRWKHDGDQDSSRTICSPRGGSRENTTAFKMSYSKGDMMDVEDFLGQRYGKDPNGIPFDFGDSFDKSDKEIFMKLLEQRNANREMSLKINKEMYDAVGQAQLLAISILLNRNAQNQSQFSGYRQSKNSSPIQLNKKMQSTDFLPPSQYSALNQRNKPWYYQDENGMKVLLDDLDCIFLETIFQRRVEDSNYLRDKQVFQLFNKVVDLNKYVVTFLPAQNMIDSDDLIEPSIPESYRLFRSMEKIRVRNPAAPKLFNLDTFELPSQLTEGYFTQSVRTLGDLGQTWQKSVNCDKHPSVNQIIDGLIQFLKYKMGERYNNVEPEKRQEVVSNLKETFGEIVSLIGFKNLNQPVDFASIQDPNSQIVCLVTWLFTIEPCFYLYIQNACQKQDYQMLQYFGPFMCIFDKILYWTEYKKPEKIQPGNDQIRVSQFAISEEALLKNHEDQLQEATISLHEQFQGSFMVYRAGKMHKETLRAWSNIITQMKASNKKDVQQDNSSVTDQNFGSIKKASEHLQQTNDTIQSQFRHFTTRTYLSATRSLETALQAFDDQDKAFDKQMKLRNVLFMMTIRNFKWYDGFEVNRKQYSAYWNEQEIILKEGIKFFLINVEKTYSKQLGKNIYVIHLLNLM